MSTQWLELWPAGEPRWAWWQSWVNCTWVHLRWLTELGGEIEYFVYSTSQLDSSRLEGGSVEVEVEECWSRWPRLIGGLLSHAIAINTSTFNLNFSSFLFSSLFPCIPRPGESWGQRMLAENFEVSRLAIPAVSVLISFLAYTSQYFFHNFKPAPLTLDEGWALNVFALCIWVCYYRACFVDPGRLDLKGKSVAPSRQEKDQSTGRQRWCRRCEAYKPPRAHHCKTCKR